jgi:methoxymalonate biosynthesis protein
MDDAYAEAVAWVGERIGDRADEWDRKGGLPGELARHLGAKGLLCAQVPARWGGLGWSSLANGQFTAAVGSWCSSLRSLMTSQGIAACAIERLGDLDQHARFLPRLAGGDLAAVAFSEPGAGSDLTAMTTTIRADGDQVVVDGGKVWVTGAQYADLVVVFGRHEGGGAAVVVQADDPGLFVEPIADPLGCRAAGHANLTLDAVRLPADRLLRAAGQPLPLLVTSALTYGRLSVAWGCLGIVQTCLRAAARHANRRHQFGVPLSAHQLVARHLAELLIAEQVSSRVCEHASRCWDDGSPDMVASIVLAKHVAAGKAVGAAATAAQVLASAGARDGHPVARAYRDAKLMEVIEGSNEICQLILAERALAVTA